VGGWLVDACNGVWFLSTLIGVDDMNKIDLIIDALERKEGFYNKYKLENALEAARELKDELYIKEMEQPTPKQSGKMLITALRLEKVTK
jgi:hypothetical protein